MVNTNSLKTAKDYLKNGDNLHKQGKIKEGVELFQKALTLNPQQPMPVYRTCGHSLISLGRFREAEKVFQKLIELYPELPDGYHGYAVVAYHLKDWELLLERWARAASQLPNHLYFQIQKASALIRLSRFDKAQAVFQEIIQQYAHHGEEKSQEAGDVVSLVELTKTILFNTNFSPAPVAKDAPSLLPKLKKMLKELLGQAMVAQEDCLERDLLAALDISIKDSQTLTPKFQNEYWIYIFKQFKMAIQLLEKESQRLNSTDWERFKVFRREIPLPLIDKLCVDNLSSSIRYVIGEEEWVTKSQVEATVKYLPELMDEEKEYFKNRGQTVKLPLPTQIKQSQTIEVFKDFICEPPYAFSEGYILPCSYYNNGISKEFINKLNCDNANGYGISDDWHHSEGLISDPRGFLAEIAISQKKLGSYYEDEVVFGVPNVWGIWGANQNYGHLLLDQISSLILYQKLNLSCKIFVPHITDDHWEIFSHLNIPKEKILVKQEQKFKYLIIGKYGHDVEVINFYRKLRESIVVKRGEIPSEYRPRYVYISRRYAKLRKMVNEVEVEELMKSLGFSVVYGERLSFEEKAMLADHTSVLVSPCGSGLVAYAVMCNPNTHVVTLLTPNPHSNKRNRIPTWYDCFISVLGNHHAYNLLGEQVADGWKMNINKLRRVITTILENENFEAKFQ
jgi:tetratricopeptide (TPR) repeat protein